MAGEEPQEATVRALLQELKRIEAQLPTPIGGVTHGSSCDEWCKLWMFLMGAWYSLGWAAHGLGKVSLKEELPLAHQFAHSFDMSWLMQLRADDMNPWYTGYFLVAAEHRIANTMHRSCKLFLGKSFSKAGINKCCSKILTPCPRCGLPALGTSALDIMNAFLSRENDPDATPLGVVFDRVNILKHDLTSDQVEKLSTQERWHQTSTALKSLLVIFANLSLHWASDERQGYKFT